MILARDLKDMSWNQHFWYWIFPIVLIGIQMSFFFSGIPSLVEIANPKMNREWGLVEHTQLGFIAIIIAISAYASFTKKPSIQKWGFGLVSAFAVFVFLEEIDYGAHIAEYLTGVSQSQLEEITGVYNIHHYGPNTAKIFKRSVYGLMLIIFIIAPILKGKFQNSVISYLIAEPKIIIIAVLTILCEMIARLLVPLNNLKLEDLTLNIGEFSEIMIYYIFLMYLIQLIFEKEWPATAKANTT